MRVDAGGILVGLGCSVKTMSDQLPRATDFKEIPLLSGDYRAPKADSPQLDMLTSPQFPPRFPGGAGIPILPDTWISYLDMLRE